MVNKFIELISMYGISHGLIVALGMALVWAVGWLTVIVGLGGSLYYYNRERKARLKDGITQFRDWPPDSKGDAVTPALVALALVFIRFSYVA